STRPTATTSSARAWRSASSSASTTRASSSTTRSAEHGRERRRDAARPLDRGNARARGRRERGRLVGVGGRSDDGQLVEPGGRGDGVARLVGPTVGQEHDDPPAGARPVQLAAGGGEGVGKVGG